MEARDVPLSFWPCSSVSLAPHVLHFSLSLHKVNPVALSDQKEPAGKPFAHPPLKPSGAQFLAKKDYDDGHKSDSRGKP